MCRLLFKLKVKNKSLTFEQLLKLKSLSIKEDSSILSLGVESGEIKRTFKGEGNLSGL